MSDWASMEAMLKEKKPAISADTLIDLARQHSAPSEAVVRWDCGHHGGAATWYMQTTLPQRGVM